VNEKVSVMMEQGQVLIPVETEIFWNKLRSIIVEVLDERDVRRRKQHEETPQLLKIKEVCELFQITKPTIYDWIRKGQLQSVKIESRRFFLYGDIEEMIAKNRGTAKEK
jgi:excisionase family DNA binding protein